jgi:hypothetical protein
MLPQVKPERGLDMTGFDGDFLPIINLFDLTICGIFRAME